MNRLREFYYFSTFNKCGREEALPGYIYIYNVLCEKAPSQNGVYGGQVGGVGPWNSIKRSRVGQIRYSWIYAVEAEVQSESGRCWGEDGEVRLATRQRREGGREGKEIVGGRRMLGGYLTASTLLSVASWASFLSHFHILFDGFIPLLPPPLSLYLLPRPHKFRFLLGVTLFVINLIMFLFSWYHYLCILP